jgi:hypothetical protein
VFWNLTRWFQNKWQHRVRQLQPRALHSTEHISTVQTHSFRIQKVPSSKSAQQRTILNFFETFLCLSRELLGEQPVLQQATSASCDIPSIHHSELSRRFNRSAVDTTSRIAGQPTWISNPFSSRRWNLQTRRQVGHQSGGRTRPPLYVFT